MALPAVRGGAQAFNEAPLLKAGKYPAQISAVECKVPAELRRGRVGPVGELVKDACLGEGEGAVQRRIVKNPDPLRVEAVEGADRRGITGRNGFGTHGQD